MNKPEWLTAKGPLLLACNHPNSFLDGIILTILFEEKVYSLARGDAFKKHLYNRLLRRLNLLPVYRTSEGVQNLEHNYTTFEACIEIFKQKGIVIIFSEGRCINEWHLRPLKKGTARLATNTWLQDIDLTVLPVGLNYNMFRNFGKNVFVNFGEPLDKQAILEHMADGKMFSSFNEQLRKQLKGLVYEINFNDGQKLLEKVSVTVPPGKRLALLIPAIIGFILHLPFYYPAKAINRFYFNNDHFDSTLVGILVLFYPSYLVLAFFLIGLNVSWLLALTGFIILPLTAWACVQLKPQQSR